MAPPPASLRLVTPEIGTALPLGERLAQRGLISRGAIITALENQRRWGCRFGEALIAAGAINALNLAEALAEGFGLSLVDLVADPPDAALSASGDLDLYLAKLFLPWRKVGETIVIACANPSPEMERFIAQRYGAAARIAITGKFDILWAVQKLFGPVLGEAAALRLHQRDPASSARGGFSFGQRWAGLAVFTALGMGFAAAPDLSSALVLLLMSLCYTANIVLRLLLFAAAASHGEEAGSAPIDRCDDASLPIYTILVPLYREANMVGPIAAALKRLDYPAAKLDLKIVLEEDDADTIAAAKAQRLDSRFELIVVPRSPLRTKPRACNYALAFARGAYTVIYDAEDRPEPDQLRKAISAFGSAPHDVACLQAHLNVYNTDQNWLTRMFALEYAAWFDFLLPGLARLGIPIPLGGTSNHFRTDVLRGVLAWDAFNVTEDADLGLRLARRGYRVLPLSSTTYEEAVPTVSGWVRQRSRWLKGYMQTALVHGRAPVAFARAVGLGGFAGASVFIGGAVMTALLAPPFWILSIALQFWGSEFLLGRYGEAVLQASYVSLLGGNIILTLIGMIAPLKRRWFRLIPYGITVFGYWLLISLAAYRALWQLFTDPSYWEKTEHGVSAQEAAQSASQPAAAGAT